MRGELETKDNAIASLETKLSGAVLQLKERDDAIANLNPEPTPEPEPEPTPTPEPEPTPTPTPEPEILKPESTPQPEPNPEPTDTTGTLTRGELVKYIHSSFPGATITGQNIGDCYSFDKKGRLKSSKMPEFEVTYGFKYLGKIDGVNRFQPIPKL